jgi:hypothetical protein
VEAGSGELTWKGEGVHEVFDFYPKILPGERTARLAFQSERWGALPQEITIEAGEGFEALGAALRFREADPRRPLEADPGTMMYWPPARWRNSSHELFSHNLYPEIIYLVTESFAVQSRFLKRLAFFTEKPGFAGRIAGDEEIAGQRDWFAHDYRASGLAAFFQLARTENFPLNESEILLREILLAHGVIRETGGRLIEGKGALVGLSVESRNRLPVYYVHETVHGLEFTMPELRKLFMEFFDSLSAAEQRFMREALLYREYNVEADRRLLASETAAYLLQQKPGETDRYFREYIRPWYRAYRRVPGTGAGADAAGETLAALDGEGGIFGRRASALQRRFEEITGLRAETFYDLLPKDRSL